MPALRSRRRCCRSAIVSGICFDPAGLWRLVTIAAANCVHHSRTRILYTTRSSDHLFPRAQAADLAGERLGVNMVIGHATIGHQEELPSAGMSRWLRVRCSRWEGPSFRLMRPIKARILLAQLFGSRVDGTSSCRRLPSIPSEVGSSPASAAENRAKWQILPNRLPRNLCVVNNGSELQSYGVISRLTKG